MGQNIKKLLLAGIAVVVSVVLVVTVTYAWTTLSKKPQATGMQISLGGGNTILLAPDVKKEVDGKICHYPGNFNDTLVFYNFEGYNYLNELNPLKPVSTADGINWFVPSYYDITDEEVKNGTAHAGQVKPIEYFSVDNELLNANLNEDKKEKGHYVYLDFWVVSPKTDYVLRVSQGDENGGSYLIELPDVIDGENGLQLDKATNSFTASARIGFLVNKNYSSQENFNVYQNSRYFNSSYTVLAGAYQEKGELLYPGDYRFYIYEPNGDFYPDAEAGRYVVTKPVGLVDGKPCLVEVNDRLSVQLTNKWKTKNTGRVLDEIFTAFTMGKTFNNKEDAKTTFYYKYLQGQFSAYVSKGEFVKNTSELYDKCAQNGQINATDLISLRTAGATDDQYITKLNANIPQRIRMFIWLEGQDVDCTQMVQGGRFALSLELAGANR